MLKYKIYSRTPLLCLLVTFSCSLLAPGAFAQSGFKILHYTETSGYDHGSRQHSLEMFQALGAEHNFSVDHDNDGSAFNSLSNLKQYAVVVFSNTSGDAILSAGQQANLKQYIQEGGSFVGIHAATDTYRHSSANGSNRGTWDWYAELVGGSVQEDPNHVSGTPLYEMSKIGTHPTTANLPDPWAKDEEYYYWENGYLHPDNTNVLEVEQTIGPNNEVNSYDQVRPMSWFRLLPGGGKSFYTALGHSSDDYVEDQNFITHIRDAVLWAAGTVTSIGTVHPEGEETLTFTNPVRTTLQIVLDGKGNRPYQIGVYNILGKPVYLLSKQAGSSKITETIALPALADGVYFFRLTTGSKTFTRRFVVAP